MGGGFTASGGRVGGGAVLVRRGAVLVGHNTLLDGGGAFVVGGGCFVFGGGAFVVGGVAACVIKAAGADELAAEASCPCYPVAAEVVCACSHVAGAANGGLDALLLGRAELLAEAVPVVA